jgi:hypothetical protein
MTSASPSESPGQRSPAPSPPQQAQAAAPSSPQLAQAAALRVIDIRPGMMAFDVVVFAGDGGGVCV